jgi:hypothetical protein
MTEQLPIRTFKLLHGRHAEGKDENGKQKIYVANEPGNDIIRTHRNLNRFNGGGNAKKYLELAPNSMTALPVPVPAAVPSQPAVVDQKVVDNLLAMKKEELVKVAKEEGVDITGLTPEPTAH